MSNKRVETVRKQVTMPRNNVVRDAFLLLLAMTGIALALSSVFNKATTSLNPFFPERVKYFVSPPRADIKLPLETVPSSAPTDELGKILATTANSNKTVILTALNWAWAEPNTMIDLFLESFRIGEGTQELLQNLLIVALDAKTYNRCLEIHLHCYSLKTRGVDFSGEKFFMSGDYLKMMWTRLGFLGDVLTRGYTIIFSDADIMWLRNPMGRLEPDADIQITSDRYNGDPFDMKNEANTGYMRIRSNQRTISFFRYWYLSRRLFPGKKEQDVLNILKLSRGFSRRGLKFMFLDTKYFGGFCERSHNLEDAYTMHANCCRGLKAKLIDLRNTLEDWSHYKGPPPNKKLTPKQWRFPDACINSWLR